MPIGCGLSDFLFSTYLRCSGFCQGWEFPAEGAMVAPGLGAKLSLTQACPRMSRNL